MDVMFEVILAPGTSGDELLSAQTREDTGARLLSADEAKGLGLPVSEGLAGAECVIIVVPKRDERRIMNAIEASPGALKFRLDYADL